MKLVLGRINPTIAVKAVQLRADITYSKASVMVIIDERGLNKYARDYVNEIDQLTFVIGKGLIDYPQTIDELVFDAIKTLVDTPQALEALSRVVTYVRSYADSVSIPDVILGKRLDKGVEDELFAVDALTSFGITTKLSETQTVIDNADANSGYGLEYTDVKPSSDLVGSTDQATTAFGKGINDSASALEAYVYSMQKALADASGAADVIALANDRSFSDTYTVTEAFSRVFSANLTQSDSALTADTLASIGVDKLLTEALSLVSSGSLRMTDYVDITYMAEDYVGSSTTFS